jgi:hypothetical protein
MKDFDKGYWIGSVVGALCAIVLALIFPNPCRADVIIIQSPGGVQTGTIITFPTPPSPYNPTWTPNGK